MKKTKSVNNLLINSSSERGQKFKNIMNSPNFGKQQIILQSCCFFDYEKSQTPHASHSSFSFSNNNYQKNKLNSSHISEKNRTIFSKNKSNMDLIKSKLDEMRKNEIQKLKNENKVLKDTINNLISQLDKTFHLAKNVKNKEKNMSENMNSKIHNLLYEKQQLLRQIKTREDNFNNIRRNSWTNFQIKKFRNNRSISSVNSRYNKFKNNNICYTENNDDKNDNKNIDMFNSLEEENMKLKCQLNDDNMNKVSIDLFNQKDTKTLTMGNHDIEKYKIINHQNKISYDKRLNKRKFIFNKKKAERTKTEYPLT